jgi:phage-related baseplate assembly protein
VINATVLSYDLNLKILITRGPDPTLIKAQSVAAVRAYAQSVHKIGQTAYVNSLLAAARVGGVLNVTSVDTINDIVCDGTQVPWLNNLTITTQDETDDTSAGGLNPSSTAEASNKERDARTGKMPCAASGSY